VNLLLRLLFVLWTVLFLAISCAPLYADSGVVGALGFLTGTILLVPWLLGCAVLAFLIWLTNPRRL
jgi:hypothetical protein